MTRDEELAAIESACRDPRVYRRITHEMVAARDLAIEVQTAEAKMSRRRFVNGAKGRWSMNPGRRGRGERFSPEKRAQALAALAAGEALDAVALRFGCSRQTLYRWQLNARS